MSQHEYEHASEIEHEYQSVLGRSVDSEGLSYFNQLLQGGTLSLSGLHDALLNSPEGLEHRGVRAQGATYEHHAEIEHEYQSVLGRSVDSEGLSYFNQLLQGGTLSLSGLHDALVNSPEGLAHHVPLLVGQQTYAGTGLLA